jgi:hypothetical protein
MSPPARYRPSAPSADDDSSVRERAQPSVTPTSTPAISASATRDRLEAKLRTGRAVLAGLPAADDRARLLHVAIMRRDEALLDGVLAALGVMPGSVPPPSR